MATPLFRSSHLIMVAAGWLSGVMLCGALYVASRPAESSSGATDYEAELVTAHDLEAPQRRGAVQEIRAIDQSAQTCSERGMIRGRSTSGRCCWFGQRWSSDKERCVGEPFACPQGRIALNQTCLALKMPHAAGELARLLEPARPDLRACLERPDRHVQFDLSLSSRGQAFGISSSVGQHLSSAEVECLQRRLIAYDFPPGHAPQRAHYVTLTP